MKAVILVGIMNSGKTTQVREMSRLLSLETAISSEILESREAYDPDFARINRECRNEGILVPDDVVIKVLLEHLKHKMDVKSSIVLDGFVRTAEQVEAVISYLKATRYEITICFLHLPNEVMFERASKRGRPDDVPTILEKRMGAFYDNLAPVLAKMVSMGYSIHTINAGMSQHDVTSEICKVAGFSLCLANV